MKSIRIVLAFLLLSLCTRAQDLDVITYTSPEKLVNDYTIFLSKESETRLETKLVAFDNKTTTQIAILMVGSLKGRNLEETATTIFNSWGLGQKGKNNGILILVATADRKIRIEIGDGLREVITNEDAAAIIQKDISPSFKAGKYYEGLNKATASLMMRAVKAFPPITGANKMDAPVFHQTTPVKEAIPAGENNKAGTAATGKSSNDGAWSWTTFWALVIPYLIWKFFKNMYLRNKYAKEMLAGQQSMLQAQGQYVQPGVTVNNYNQGLSWWQWLWLRRRNKIEQNYNQHYYYGNNSSSGGSSSSGSSGSSGGGWFKGSGGGSSSGSGSSGSWGGKSSGGSNSGGGSYGGGGGGSSSGGGASGGW